MLNVFEMPRKASARQDTNEVLLFYFVDGFNKPNQVPCYFFQYLLLHHCYKTQLRFSA